MLEMIKNSIQMMQKESEFSFKISLFCQLSLQF